MSKIKLRVVGTTLSNNTLSVYLEDGTTRTFPQGDSRIGLIVAQSLADLGTKGLPVTEIEIEDKDQPTGLGSILAKLEELSNNMVTFSKLDEIITAKVKEIIGDKELTHSLNGVEKIDKYIVAAVDEEKTEGVVKLIERLAKMETQREHSAQDVLDFLQSAHLPVTAKGDIIFFKSVDSRGSYCVDCYTGIIRQKPGTLVKMDESLVDPNRNSECSYGLHVASIEYATCFYGNAMLLGIVEPENIIAVPHGDTSKVRVSEYLVLHKLSLEDNEMLRKTRDLACCSKSLNNLVVSLVEGNYDLTPTSQAILTERMADINNINYINFEDDRVTQVKVTETPKVVTKLEPVAEDALRKRNAVSPKKVNSSLTASQRISMYFSELDKTSSDSNKKDIIGSMLELKRKQKKPWTKLGLSVAQEAKLLKLIKDLEVK